MGKEDQKKPTGKEAWEMGKGAWELIERKIGKPGKENQKLIDRGAAAFCERQEGQVTINYLYLRLRDLCNFWFLMGPVRFVPVFGSKPKPNRTC